MATESQNGLGWREFLNKNPFPPPAMAGIPSRVHFSVQRKMERIMDLQNALGEKGP